MFGKKPEEQPVEVTGIKVTRDEQVVTTRTRSKAEEAKLAILKDLLDIIGSEDIDSMFIAMLDEARSRGYNLRDEPEALLHRLNRQHA